ncbi:putative reverse transcriptase domain-containing protein [Tanacetum coccineum]
MPPRQSTRVNNEADPAFTAAVAHAVADLLPTLTARLTDKIRQNKNNENNGPRRNARSVNTGGSGNDEDAQPTDIHVWFERLATYKLEGDAHSWWRAYKKFKGGDAYVATLSWNDFRDIFFLQYFPYSEKERVLNTEFTDVAQVANAARNIEIFHDRTKNKGDNKRDRDGHHIRPSETSSQGSNPRADDRRDSDRYGNSGRHGNRDRYGTNRWRGDRQGSDRHGNGSDRQGNGSQKVWHDQDQRVRGQHYSRSYGSSSQKGYSDYNSSSPCNLCGKFHPGKACHRGTGACFECGEVGHLAKDCKKGSTSSEGKRLGSGSWSKLVSVRVRVGLRLWLVIMPPHRSTRVNNKADPDFTVAVAQAVADLLPTLTARITDEIRQNKNNGNNGPRRNARSVNTRGSGNDGDAKTTDIHVCLERSRKEKPQTFSSAYTPVEAENWISHIEKIFEVLGCDDQFKARLATYKLEGDAHSWWMAYKQAKGGDAYVATLSWNDFRDIFFLQ